MLTYSTDEDIAFIMENYLSKDDAMYEMLDEYLKLVAEADGVTIELTEEVSPTDPHHCGKEGDPLQIPLLTLVKEGTTE